MQYKPKKITECSSCKKLRALGNGMAVEVHATETYSRLVGNPALELCDSNIGECSSIEEVHRYSLRKKLEVPHKDIAVRAPASSRLYLRLFLNELQPELCDSGIDRSGTI
jgi:hypothetical protein